MPQKILEIENGVHIKANAETNVPKPEAEDEVRLLVLYCGGTIGMKTHNGVYCPEPNYLTRQLKKLPIFHDEEYLVQDNEQFEYDYLVMPLSKQGRRVVYYIYEYEPLLDSSNMNYNDYARLAGDIEKNYTKYDAFLVLHGTDTMAYTASALSFMFENLGKMVVVTGSQIPIFETRSDGRDNFLGALTMAAHYHIPEVTIFFNNQLLRGNRSLKADAEGFDAFHSPNMPPLATLEISIKVHWDSVFRHRGRKKFSVHPNMCPNVGVLRLFPSITPQTVEAFLQPPLEGVVIQTYGAGNGPSGRKDLLAILRRASERGVILLNITQCSRGSVSPLYAAGKELQDVGMIPGCDMTVEAALTKMSCILSKTDWPTAEKRRMMGVNIRGEMSVGTTEESNPAINYSLIEKLADAMRLSTKEEVHMLQDAVFPSLLCAAAREGNIEGLDKLKEVGAMFSMADYDGRTPLHIACCEGKLETVNHLLEYGAPVHKRDRYGHSPLNDALNFNHHHVIQTLRESGAHLMLSSNRTGMNLCSIAAQDDLVAMKSWYLAGADINQADYDGRTALHLAVVHGNKEMVRYLLQCGADPKMLDCFHNSPIDEAMGRNASEILQLLQI